MSLKSNGAGAFFRATVAVVLLAALGPGKSATSSAAIIEDGVYKSRRDVQVFDRNGNPSTYTIRNCLVVFSDGARKNIFVISKQAPETYCNVQGFLANSRLVGDWPVMGETKAGIEYQNIHLYLERDTIKLNHSGDRPEAGPCGTRGDLSLIRFNLKTRKNISIKDTKSAWGDPFPYCGGYVR